MLSAGSVSRISGSQCGLKDTNDDLSGLALRVALVRTTDICGHAFVAYNHSRSGHCKAESTSMRVALHAPRILPC